MLKKAALQIFDFLKGVFYLTWAIFLIWLVICSFDVSPPIKDLEITTTNGSPGKEVDVTYRFLRTRQCRIKGTVTITDVKGQAVFTKNIGRTVNGNLGSVEQLDHYKIDNDANLGEGSLNVYFEWECPYNIVHSMLKPITFEHQVLLMITEKQ